MNETFYIGAILLVAGILIGIVLVMAFNKIASYEQRLKALEECQKKRLPYNTAAGIEDATAVLLDLQRQFAQEDLERDVSRARARKLMEIILLLRGGPGEYDPDKPAGKRP